MRTTEHDVDICVVGGGLAGLCAAVAAARHGAKVALMHDRPVLGGNASSEIRMWICGARGANNRETGIIEEILLENLWRNPLRNYSIWDSILYEKARFEPNITLLLNCSCNDVQMDGPRIESVKGWQLTSETWHVVRAEIFIDCSGDSILAPLSGAEFRYGREAADEFNEDIAPETADTHTMGMSCLIQARETTVPCHFTPPAWANVYPSDDDLPNREHDLGEMCNFWWLEIGGVRDTIHDTESIRDELLKIAFGVWDHIKNCGDHGAGNWTLEWVGFLPGKRESRRYVGDYVLTQHDVRHDGAVEDVIAYGGWPMDDHHPHGFEHPGPPTSYHNAASPFGIPYRCVYSRNIDNLMFAGRNISATHMAMSATRVMATCATLGQAVGTAASMAVRDGLSPRQVGQNRIGELQQTLMDDDCWLPGKTRAVSDLSVRGELTVSNGDSRALRNGRDRRIGEAPNAWFARVGDWVEYRFEAPREICACRLVLDSHLKRKELNACCRHTLAQLAVGTPATLVKRFVLEVPRASGGWEAIAEVDDNHQRLVNLPLEVTADRIRFRILETWGAGSVAVFSLEMLERCRRVRGDVDCVTEIRNKKGVVKLVERSQV